MKKYFKYLIIILLTAMFSLTSCKEDKVTIIEDNELKDSIINYEFEYDIQTPGTTLSYNFLWDGYDENDIQGYSCDESNRLYTYYADFKDIKDEYYLVYLKKDKFEQYKKRLENYENNYSNLANYQFESLDKSNVIDGKYLYAHQNLDGDDEDLLFTTSSNINDLNLNYNNYKLIFICKSKELNLISNISLNNTINKSLTILKREILEYKDNKFSNFIFSNNMQKSNEEELERYFNLKGEYLISFEKDFSSRDYLYLPYMGLNNYNVKYTIYSKVITENNLKYISLKRYYLENKEIKDYLDLINSFDSDELLYYDINSIYGKHIEEF